MPRILALRTLGWEEDKSETNQNYPVRPRLKLVKGMKLRREVSKWEEAAGHSESNFIPV